MSNDDDNPGRSKWTLVLIIIGLVAVLSVIIFSVTAFQPKTQSSFFARSINDASYDCESKIEKKYGTKLVSKYFDNHSSRYEADRRQYLIYYRITVHELDQKIPTNNDYMAKCTVWERLGYVSEFRVYEY